MEYINVKIIKVFLNNNVALSIQEVANRANTTRDTAKKHILRLKKLGCVIEDDTAPPMRLFSRAASENWEIIKNKYNLPKKVSI